MRCIADDFASHKHPKVHAWLARRPSSCTHFLSIYSRSLNQLERFFALVTDKAIRRGSFKSFKDLTRMINSFAICNENCKPFKWTATVDSILKNSPGCGRINWAEN